MNDLLTKLSSYNLFNFLFPGAIFVFATQRFGIFSLTTSNLLIDSFVIYFAGMTVSRVGSIVVEPLFRWLHIVNYAPYGDFLTASKIDPKIEVLLEINNTFRTVIALFLSILAALLLYKVCVPSALARESGHLITYVAVSLLYVLSYRKQTDYIRKRVEHHKQAP